MIGEGGSGGALGIAACNAVLMLEHAIYTVASPEASASILWRESPRAQDAATNMKITAQDLLKFGIIDGIVAEPVGGAHRDPEAAIQAAGDAIEQRPGALCRAAAAKTVRACRARKSSWRWAARSEFAPQGADMHAARGFELKNSFTMADDSPPRGKDGVRLMALDHRKRGRLARFRRGVGRIET